MRYLISGVCFLFLLVAQPVAAKPSLMPVPRTAPEWIISEWINGKGKSLKELRGKVVIVDFFQLWCPGCNQFSIPLLNHWEKVFDKEIKDGKLEIISIHTVFEGHDYQNPKKLKSFLRRKKFITWWVLTAMRRASIPRKPCDYSAPWEHRKSRLSIRRASSGFRSLVGLTRTRRRVCCGV